MSTLPQRLLALAVYAYFIGSTLHALKTRPSSAFDYWSECMLALLLCEYFLAFIGAFAAGFRKADLDGRPEWGNFLLVMVPLGLMALGAASGVLHSPIPVIAYMVLLAARVWTGVSAPRERVGEVSQQSVAAILANLVTFFPAMFFFDKSRVALVTAGSIYFSLVALYEVHAMLRPPPKKAGTDAES